MNQQKQGIIQEQWKNVPKEAQDLVLSDEFGEQIANVLDGQSLKAEQIKTYETELLLVLLMLENDADFTTNIEHNMHISHEQAEEIYIKTEQIILSPLVNKIKHSQKAVVGTATPPEKMAEYEEKKKQQVRYLQERGRYSTLALRAKTEDRADADIIRNGLKESDTDEKIENLLKSGVEGPIKNRFEQVSQNIQYRILQLGVGDIVRSIKEIEPLQEKQRVAIENEVFLVFLGLSDPQSLVSGIHHNAQISHDRAGAIAHYIQNHIFIPNVDILEKVFKNNMQEDNQNTSREPEKVAVEPQAPAPEPEQSEKVPAPPRPTEESGDDNSLPPEGSSYDRGRIDPYREPV